MDWDNGFSPKLLLLVQESHSQPNTISKNWFLTAKMLKHFIFSNKDAGI